MTDAVEELPAQWRELFVEILARRNPDLLAALTSDQALVEADLHAAKNILIDEFLDNVGADSEPNPRGKEVDDLVGVFIGCFIMD